MALHLANLKLISTNNESEEPATPKREKPPRSTASYVLLAVAVYAAIQAYWVLSHIVLSFLLIILISLALNPIVSRLRDWTGCRKRATGLILAGLLMLIGLGVWAAFVPLKQSVAGLSDKWPAYWERLQKPLIKLEKQAVISEEKLQNEVNAEIALDTAATEAAAPAPPMPTAKTPKPVRTQLRQLVEHPSEPKKEEGSLRSNLAGMIKGVMGQMKEVAFNTTQMLIVLVTVFFGVTFTLMNPHPIFGALFSVVPERHHDRTLTIMVRIAEFVPRWAGSVLISMLTIGSLFFLLMWPIFGFTDAVMLGLIACLFSAVPLLGPVLTLIPALFLALGEGGMTPVWVLLAYGAVQALEGNVIIPIILSRGMNLHPVAVIFSMLLSAAAFGLLGVIIAAPLVAIVGILHEELYRKHFLPTSTDEDLNHLAGSALLENPGASKP